MKSLVIVGGVRRKFKHGEEQYGRRLRFIKMDTFIQLFPLISILILTAVNFYIAYITFRMLKISIVLLKETVVIREETILIKEISQRVEDKL